MVNLSNPHTKTNLRPTAAISSYFLIKCCLPSLHVLFVADFSKVSARNQQGDSKGTERGQQWDGKKICVF